MILHAESISRQRRPLMPPPARADPAVSTPDISTRRDMLAARTGEKQKVKEAGRNYYAS
jgi:hypothetical protein